MLGDELIARTYCQQCGKELSSTTSEVIVGLSLCSECKMSIYGTPSYVEATLNKTSINMLSDAANYQNSRLQIYSPDLALDMSNTFNIEPTTLGKMLPSMNIGTIFDDVGALQQNILKAATLEPATINSIANTITEASLKITDTLSSVIQTDSYMEQLTNPSYVGWLNPDNIVDSSVLSASVNSRMTSLLGTSILADNASLSFDPSKLYEIPGIHGNIAELSINSLNDLAGEYRSLWTESYNNYDSIMGSSSLVVERPPFEIYQAGILAEVIAPLKEPELEEVLAKSREIICAPTDIRYKILSLGESFLGMYDGAIGAMKIPVADSQRHVCVSLRELVTHTIHKLAPDKEVEKYLDTLGDKQEYLHKGRPTRKGRIRYICRNIEMGGFSKFVDADAKSASAFMDLLQEGTHSLEIPYSDTQLTALISRAEGLLSFIIDISNA